MVTPVIVRYMHREFVDRFFETGALRLSSYEHFGTHADEQRRDAREGESSVLLQNQGKAPYGVGAFIRSGRNSYVLCASMLESRRLLRDFKCDGAFRILNSVAFANAVAAQLLGFVGGAEGPCAYSTERGVVRDLTDEALPTSEIGDRVAESIADDLLFGKDVRYAPQQEYRLIWNVDHEVTGTLDITCPSAIGLCERVESF